MMGEVGRDGDGLISRCSTSTPPLTTTKKLLGTVKGWRVEGGGGVERVSVMVCVAAHVGEKRKGCDAPSSCS